ncbi:hypothetical protein [Thermopetrobacter sp. TC1]|uniref:hypothetical protein n=1 Tax=Thermopetrobacter sp. TC1 TaxID=1495045 RepID=UPI0012E0025A|nr:hypothetical protein [Thermopetrobacter sp. TC1]
MTRKAKPLVPGPAEKTAAAAFAMRTGAMKHGRIALVQPRLCWQALVAASPTEKFSNRPASLPKHLVYAKYRVVGRGRGAVGGMKIRRLANFRLNCQEETSGSAKMPDANDHTKMDERASCTLLPTSPG